MGAYDIDYNDRRFVDVKNEEATALKETQGTYDKMVNQTDSYYQQQIDASKEWANKQSEIQQAQSDLAIEKIEQAKDQANKSYVKEQKGAYTDYQKATNQYGANAEALASQGLNQTGYSESTRTNAYNTYQNRYLAARESYNQAILNYDNSIKEAQLANNSALATIAYEALQKQLELSLQGFQYKNTLLLQKLDAVNQTKDRYYTRYQDVLQQINTENSMAEQIRQFNEKMAEEKRQYNETMAFQKQQAAQEQSNWERQFALAKSSSSGGSSGGSGSGSKNVKTGSKEKESSKESSNQTLQKNVKATADTAAKTASSVKSTASKVLNSVKNAFGGSSSKTTSSSSGSSGYSNVLRQAIMLSKGSGKNKSSIEALLGAAMGQGTITKAQAQSILKQVGM